MGSMVALVTLAIGKDVMLFAVLVNHLINTIKIALIL